MMQRLVLCLALALISVFAGLAENSDPLYLPDGRIAFMSHRPGGLVQSVWASAPGERRADIVGTTRLPAWKDQQEKWAEITADVPLELTAHGRIALFVQNPAGTANAVVSEIWLLESR
ncbi:MAG: hypothetical protein QM473_11530 [Acidobacteriota bacterium]|nr:hypothetical protein [Acidobacteriota bacterium]